MTTDATTANLLDRGTASRAGRSAAAGIVALCAALAGANVLEIRLMSATHGEPIEWYEVLALTGPRWVLLAGLLCLVLGLARRFPVWPLTIRALIAHILGFGVVALVHSLVYTIVLRQFETSGSAFSFALHQAGTLLRTMPVLLLLYAAALGTARMIDTTLDRHARELQASQLQAELSAARLAALRAQLHPHFLYNALHAIGALIADDQKSRALAATEHLGDLLHAAFRDDGRDLIPFSEEMELVSRYLALQQMRFADRLIVLSIVEPQTAKALIPPLLLQPIVENAVQHGLAGITGPVTVSIAGAIVNDRVSVIIENDGAPVTKEPSLEGGKGVGIPNTRGRLKTIYGADAELRLTARPHGGVTATLLLPLRYV